MKKILIYLLTIAIVFCALTAYTAVSGSAGDGEAGAVSLNIGDYILLGKYYDEPILWRYVDMDENGMLILSDKVIAFKAFGETNFWYESSLRKWLNSDVQEGEEEWYVAPSANSNFRMHADEKGFLHQDNFCSSERVVMKSTVQWTMIPSNNLNFVENEEMQTYSAIKEHISLGGNDGYTPVMYNVTNLPDIYFGAAHQVEDTMFLLDEMQAYRVWNTFGELLCKRTRETLLPLPDFSDHNFISGYFLRTPTGRYYVNGINANAKGDYTIFSNNHAAGIRPAFYLNEFTAVILSGSGTEDDPYVIDGREGEDVSPEQKGEISVFINGTRIEFDQPPIMESDRVLVPLRAIFEALGAEVDWEEVTSTVTAKKNGIEIILQIGSNILFRNGEEIELDVPPKIVNDRTLVPIRAVSEGLGARVEWDGDALAVRIWTE